MNDPLADLKESGQRLRAARSRQAAALAAHVRAMWQALQGGRISRNKVVAASELTRQAGWDALALAGEASAAYRILQDAGIPTDRQAHGEDVEVSIRPLSTRRALVSLDAVPQEDGGGAVPSAVWGAAMAALRGAGWAPEEVEQPEDPDAGYWPQATIQRRPAA